MKELFFQMEKTEKKQKRNLVEIKNPFMEGKITRTREYENTPEYRANDKAVYKKQAPGTKEKILYLRRCGMRKSFFQNRVHKKEGTYWKSLLEIQGLEHKSIIYDGYVQKIQIEKSF